VKGVGLWCPSSPNCPSLSIRSSNRPDQTRPPAVAVAVPGYGPAGDQERSPPPPPPAPPHSSSSPPSPGPHAPPASAKKSAIGGGCLVLMVMLELRRTAFSFRCWSLSLRWSTLRSPSQSGGDLILPDCHSWLQVAIGSYGHSSRDCDGGVSPVCVVPQQDGNAGSLHDLPVGHGGRYTVLCSTVLCYTVLCYTVLCYTVLFYTVLCYTLLCYTVLCYTVLCDTVLCDTV
jgi:hypothetical protein